MQPHARPRPVSRQCDETTGQLAGPVRPSFATRDRATRADQEEVVERGREATSVYFPLGRISSQAQAPLDTKCTDDQSTPDLDCYDAHLPWRRVRPLRRLNSNTAIAGAGDESSPVGTIH